MGHQVSVFSEDSKDPAAQVLSHWSKGSLSDSNSLIRFAETVDHLTFESEFAPVEALLEMEKLHPQKIFPCPSLMKRIQSKWTQKELLTEFQIPTSPYCKVNSVETLRYAWKDLDGPFVLKVNFGGYDGYGIHFVEKLKNLQPLEERMKLKPQDWLAEKHISFKRELASILIRSSNSDCISLPLVETFQTHGKCDWVRGPVQHKAWPSLEKKLKQMMKKLDYVGALAVEMFDTGSALLINELAPRVHNSGHYSQNALSESQFSLHIRAGLGEKIQAPQLLSPQFVMANLIGQSTEAIQVPQELSGSLHLYGKLENRPGRKMGHVNYLGPKGPALLQKALKERKRFQL